MDCVDRSGPREGVGEDIREGLVCPGCVWPITRSPETECPQLSPCKAPPGGHVSAIGDRKSVRDT